MHCRLLHNQTIKQQQAMQMAQAQAMQMQGGQGGPPGSPPLEEPASAVANEVGA